MKDVLAAMCLLAVAVSSAPLVMDSHLLTHGDVNGRLAVMHHVSHVHGVAAGKNDLSAPRLRFVLMVPTLHKLGELKDGFASQALGLGSKHHKFLDLEAHEHLVDLAGLSNCKTWHGVLLKLWTATGLVYKAVAGVKENGVMKLHHFAGVADLADFLKGHLMLQHFKGLLEKGVAAHVLTHHLHHMVGHLL